MVPYRNHYIESASALEWTWRAHAGHFPVPESFPYIALVWERRVVTRIVPIRGGNRGRGEKPRTRTVTTVIRVPRWITDFKPWTVEGKHYEDTGSGETIRTSSATGCHWDNTFNFY